MGVAVGKGHLFPLSYHDDNSAPRLTGRRNLIGWLRKPPGSPVGRKRDRDGYQEDRQADSS